MRGMFDRLRWSLPFSMNTRSSKTNPFHRVFTKTIAATPPTIRYGNAIHRRRRQGAALDVEAGSLPFDGADNQEVLAKQVLEALSGERIRALDLSPQTHYAWMVFACDLEKGDATLCSWSGWGVFRTR